MSRKPPRDDGSADRLSTGQERAAGLIDGLKAGRIDLLNTIARSLVWQRIEIGPGHEPRRVQGVPAVDVREVPGPDNPEDRSAYREGWHLGWRRGREALLDHLRPRLSALDLTLADDGSVHPLSAAPARPARSRLAGVLTMIRRHVDRRTAIVALGATLISATGTWIGLNVSTPSREVAQYTALPWKAPHTWDHLPTELRSIYLAIDHWVYDKEQAHLRQDVSSLLSIIASSQGADEVKNFAINYVRDSGKGAYLNDLLPVLDPALTSESARGFFVAATETILVVRGPASLPPGIRVALQTYRNSAVETNLRTIGALDRLIPALIAAGL